MNRLSDSELAARVAFDIPDGSYVNLGIGKPTHVSAHVPEGREVIYHSENGILGVGPTPPEGEVDVEMIDASKRYITTARGASFFEHSDSFAMMRGGHLDIAVLGAYRVDENGPEVSARRGWRDGSGCRGPDHLCHDAAHEPRWQPETAAQMHLSADGTGCGQPDLYRSCGARCHQRRLYAG